MSLDLTEGKILRARIAPSGTEVAQGEREILTWPYSLRIARRGRILSVGDENGVFSAFRGSDPLSGTKIGMVDEGLGIQPSAVVAFSSETHDYTFSSAPSDWFPRGGEWEITSRWTCSPQWTWFSGVSDQLAALWNKREFGGDVTVEAYASEKMGLGGSGSYRHPHDINITLCGDGANLSSGYNFVVGGYLGSATQILKGDQVLAETRDPAFLLPRLTDGMPPMNEFHRVWWQVRAEKQGGWLPFSPLPSGEGPGVRAMSSALPLPPIPPCSSISRKTQANGRASTGPRSSA